MVSGTTATALLIAGDVDWSWKSPRAALTNLASVPGLRLVSATTLTPNFTPLVKMLLRMTVPVKSALELVEMLELRPASVLFSTRLFVEA